MQENRKIIILIFITFSTLVIAASLFVGSLYAKRNMQVLYISQTEILSLEKARIEQEPLKNRQLFFGKPTSAIEYIEKAQEKMSKNGALVLLTDSKIYGRNVHSVSKEVHEEIVKHLAGVIKSE